MKTPSAVLDPARLKRNCTRMLERAESLRVRLRPHLKTSKSVDVALLAKGGDRAGFAVSTLREAEHFAAAGFDDLFVAVPIAHENIARAAALNAAMIAGVIVAVDTVETASALKAAAAQFAKPLRVMIEIDCGDRRTGLEAENPDIASIATMLADSRGLDLAGVFTHAGHSYGAASVDEIRRIARDERDTIVSVAQRLRSAGHAVPIVSVGSTPTALFADDLAGVTEMRPGVYMFMDLDQAARGVCSIDDIALTVVASVISHRQGPDRLILDAGGLALSKDRGANDRWPDAGYGYLADFATGARLPGLAVDKVSQEHGQVMAPDPVWFDRLPVGAKVRILPNHVCFTAAAYDGYNVIGSGAFWPRVNGW